ncbi:MAG: hypothetical protein ACRC1J_08680 [Sandaracinobacteroides sp.]
MPRERDPTAKKDSLKMLNILSLVIGVAAGTVALFGLIPFIGWANWFVIPVAGIGLVLGLISSRKEGQILNLVVIAIALVRLSIGGGFI